MAIVALASLLCPDARAQAVAAPPAQSPASAPAAEESEARERSERSDRAAEAAMPQSVADAPTGNRIPGQPPPRVLRIDRGALQIRRDEYSLGVDHALSPQFALSALFGQGRARVHRVQAETYLQFPPGFPGGREVTLPVDTELRARSTSVAMALSWFPLDGVFLDLSASAALTHYEATRLNGTSTLLQEASTRGRSDGLTWTAGLVVRSNAWVLVPQLGLERQRSQVEALQMPRFSVSAQSQRTRYALSAVQLQRVFSVPWGTLTPYLRQAYRRLLRYESDQVKLVAPGPPLPFADETRTLDPDEQLRLRHVSSQGLGLLVQAPGGISVFVEFQRARGSQDLRESGLAVGLKLEH